VTLVDLSHTITDGMVTYPGLPGPAIGDFMTREESREHYAPPTEFHIGRIDMVANTGTYLDTPAHRWEGREDLSAIPLEAMAEVPGFVVRDPGPALGPELIGALDVAGHAVLFDTGWSRHWGTPDYEPPGHPHVTADLATALVEGGAVLVGIDSVNVDDTAGGMRPAHSILLEAGVLVVEHLTHLDRVPDSGFRFSAVPAKVAGLGTFPVRAFASF
jgi:kynurenine formamidase